VQELAGIVALCVVLASAETLHGIARTVLLAPRIGRRKAQQVSIFSGSLIAFVVCYLLVPGLGFRGRGELVAVGLVIAGFMAGFDAALGRLLLRRGWRKILADFNPRTGNYLIFGLMFLVLCPYLVMCLR